MYQCLNYIMESYKLTNAKTIAWSLISVLMFKLYHGVL
jgi:hypothetical protein